MPSVWIVTHAKLEWIESLYAAGWEVKVFAPSDLVPASPAPLPDPDVIIFDAAERLPFDTFREICREKFCPLLAIIANWGLAGEATEAGADQVMVAPVDPNELLFRARTLIRTSKVVRVGELTIDLVARRVKCSGRPVQLSPEAFQLLACLAKRIGQAVSYDEILDEVWGYDSESGTPAQVRNCVKRLRQKIEPDPHKPQYVISVRKFGYRLRNQAQWEEARRNSGYQN